MRRSICVAAKGRRSFTSPLKRRTASRWGREVNVTILRRASWDQRSIQAGTVQHTGSIEAKAVFTVLAAAKEALPKDLQFTCSTPALRACVRERQLEFLPTIGQWAARYPVTLKATAEIAGATTATVTASLSSPDGFDVLPASWYCPQAFFAQPPCILLSADSYDKRRQFSIRVARRDGLAFHVHNAQVSHPDLLNVRCEMPGGEAAVVTLSMKRSSARPFSGRVDLATDVESDALLSIPYAYIPESPRADSQTRPKGVGS